MWHGLEGPLNSCLVTQQRPLVAVVVGGCHGCQDRFRRSSLLTKCLGPFYASALRLCSRGDAGFLQGSCRSSVASAYATILASLMKPALSTQRAQPKLPGAKAGKYTSGG